MNNQTMGSVETQKISPYKDLLNRLKCSLGAINSKTKAFQVDFSVHPDELKNPVRKSEFEAELTELTEMAEEINNKLLF